MLIVKLIFNIIIIAKMEKKDIVTIEERRINGKIYLVPEYNLFGAEKYMLPKLDNAPVHIYYFQPHDIDELYKQQNYNPDESNLKNLKTTVELMEDEPDCRFQMQENISGPKKEGEKAASEPVSSEK
jgi:hypothetical protein